MCEEDEAEVGEPHAPDEEVGESKEDTKGDVDKADGYRTATISAMDKLPDYSISDGWQI